MSKLREALSASDEKIKAAAADARIKLITRKVEAALNATRDEVEAARAALSAALVDPSFSVGTVLDSKLREAAGLARIGDIKAFKKEYLVGEVIVNAEDVGK